MNSIDSLNHLEEQLFNSGYQLGLKDGKEAGTLEGYQMGDKEGFKLWEELAYYLGQAQIWCTTEDNTTKLYSQIQGLISLIQAFPTQNLPESDHYYRLTNIQAHYRMCRANMGLRPRIKECGQSILDDD